MSRCSCLRFGGDFRSAETDVLARELHEIAVDGESWEVVLRCPICDRWWQRTYPDAEYHAGGIPRMTVISEHSARDKLTVIESNQTERDVRP